MEQKIKPQHRGAFILLFASIVWGGAFVAQQLGAECGVFSFQAYRNILGFIPLAVFIIISDLVKRKKTNEKPDKKQVKTLLIGSAVCGSVMCIAENFQQLGIVKGSGAGKAGFITALYLVFVPIVEAVRTKKFNVKIFACAIVAMFGTVMLSGGSESGEWCIGDLYVFISAVAFTFHIVSIGYFSTKTDAFKLSALQLLVCGILSAIFAFIFDKPSVTEFKMNLWPILYTGLISCALGYTCQTIGQKYSEAGAASLIMSLESVFALITHVIFSHATDIMEEYNPTALEIIGCVIIFAMVILSQISIGRKKPKTE